jgi:hypothetical protein
MIELLKIHALVRTAGVLVCVARAVDFVLKAACRAAVALADDATARMDARNAAWRSARGKGTLK